MTRKRDWVPLQILFLKKRKEINAQKIQTPKGSEKNKTINQNDEGTIKAFQFKHDS